ncbi:MAG TPA: UDP-N-acetylglucosamine--N-acetylmuramyl-(pentapeptide) pyrophosphoryl-undecaprenol N-acetylglucosamine transferase [Phycisphaerae bacterium]|nr:UDP-N-acetylglucosamine--N-acetylmuramyl-(pentapeptide) pyrophosphoryl-undecaprenol N-acetylglucosamine transferase [Phycisphaerae bacterium]HNU44713.1 UDP-N-acetylglucosamine--N-acetylmuramyl-(pentapeptide) pyrophosphoryl-undecaprenol N-acetylglucosamine transferase [Phycisphaerae bacterium]
MSAGTATDVRDPVVAVAGGGTGGHLYPALAVAEVLRERLAQLRFVFFATDRAIDEQILGGREACTLVRQSLPPLHPAPWRWPGILRGLSRARRQARAWFERQRPMLVLGTGGLASVPAVLEALRAGIPAALLNPDAIPGRANRFLARRMDAVFVQWEDSIRHFPRGTRLEALGCAIRPGFGTPDRAAGVRHFDLDPARRTLLATGASQGARTLNDALVANLDRLEQHGGWQVLHLTGKLDYERVAAAYQGRRLPARVLSYTEAMPAALAAADLVLSRAGASTLAEITAVGRASVLMPYPFHRDMHQLANARCLERRGAARIVADTTHVEQNGPALGAVLDELMTDDQMLETLTGAARRMGCADAAGRIADRVLMLARGVSCESVQASY